MSARILRRCLCVGAALLTAAAAASGQRQRDPFTQAEIYQIRDVSWEPQQRLALYVKFARERLVALEQMRNDPKVKERGRQTHDMLEDFLAVYDELDDNVDMYFGRRDDIRKPLKAVIEADTEFQSKLRALKNSGNTNADELKLYEFQLTDALDTVDSSADDHRKTLAEVEQYVKHKKK